MNNNQWHNGWLKAAQHILSPNYNERPKAKTIDLLVIHCISLPQGQYENINVEHFFCNKLDTSQDKSLSQLDGLKVSSHFYIKRNGELIQFVSVDNRAWHAGESSYLGRKNCNDFSVGIELQGTGQTTYSKVQYAQLIKLTKLLQIYFPLIKDNIVSHQEIAPLRKTDPGIGFDWAYYLTQLGLNKRV